MACVCGSHYYYCFSDSAALDLAGLLPFPGLDKLHPGAAECGVAHGLAWAWLPHLGALSGTRLHGARASLCVNEILMALGVAAEALGSETLLQARVM